MKVAQTSIPDLLIIEPKVFGDERGFFYESFNQRKFSELTGLQVEFVQDNHSKSAKGVLRGLHYQIQNPQGKLVRTVHGAILDVAVDIRKSSPTFGQHMTIELSAENKRMLWIPAGFAHGFVVLTEAAEVLYKTTDYWSPEHERCIRWNDEELSIPWGLTVDPILSVKDAGGVSFKQAELFD